MIPSQPQVNAKELPQNDQKRVLQVNFHDLTASIKDQYTQSCPKHPEEMTNYICIDEQVLFCSECLLDDIHANHKKMKLNTYFSELAKKSEGVKSHLDLLSKQSSEKSKIFESQIDEVLIFIKAELMRKVGLSNEKGGLEGGSLETKGTSLLQNLIADLKKGERSLSTYMDELDAIKIQLDDQNQLQSLKVEACTELLMNESKRVIHDGVELMNKINEDITAQHKERDDLRLQQLRTELQKRLEEAKQLKRDNLLNGAIPQQGLNDVNNNKNMNYPNVGAIKLSNVRKLKSQNGQPGTQQMLGFFVDQIQDKFLDVELEVSPGAAIEFFESAKTFSHVKNFSLSVLQDTRQLPNDTKNALVLCDILSQRLPEFSQLTNLKILIECAHTISSKHLTMVAQGLISLVKLKTFNFNLKQGRFNEDLIQNPQGVQKNNLENQGFNALMKAVRKMTQLEELTLKIGKRGISGLEPVDKLCFYIENSETLREINLNLSSWDIDNDCMLSICSSCCKVPTLKVLVLDLPTSSQLIEGKKAMLNVILKKSSLHRFKINGVEHIN